MNAYQWLTTAPNPRSSATGHDAGQRGWRLHAIQASSGTKLTEVRFRSALCGLRPRHGWGLDAFVEDKCARCQTKMKLLELDSGNA